MTNRARTATAPSFAEFAQQNRIKARHKKCVVGQLPADVREQVEWAWANGHRMKTVNAYLDACGHERFDENWTRRHFRDRDCGCWESA